MTRVRATLATVADRARGRGVTAPRTDRRARRALAQLSSTLPRGPARLLAHMIEHGLVIGIRRPEDFVRHFPPGDLARVFVDIPTVRMRFLELALGLRREYALRIGPVELARMLEDAHRSGELDAEVIVRSIPADERVRRLDARALWAYALEGEFWRVTEGADAAKVRAHVGYLLERAVLEGLLAPDTIVARVGIARLVAGLPREVIAGVLTEALEHGRASDAFHEFAFVSAISRDVLAAHLPLPVLWNDVVEPAIAGPIAALRPPPAPDDGIVARTMSETGPIPIRLSAPPPPPHSGRRSNRSGR